MDKESGHEIIPAGAVPFPDVEAAGPEDMGYHDSIGIIRDELQKTRQSCIKIGWFLKHIKEKEMYREDGYADIYEFAEDKFHITQPTATRFMNLCIQFSIGHNSPEVDEKYKKYTVSQLIEILPMKQGQKERVSPDMTVRQIREIKKEGRKETAKGGSDTIGRDAPGEAYATSHTENAAEGCLPKETSQPELPEFWNNAERKKWIEDVEAWGIWYEDPNIHARYYKYDFEDGSRLIAVKYRYTCPPRIKEENNDKASIEADGGYKDTYYHMVFSESYWRRHPAEYRDSYEKYYVHKPTAVGLLVKFLKELQDERQTSADEASREDNGESRRGIYIDFARGYISNGYVMTSFDPLHLEEEENKDKPYITRQYVKFYKKHGYIPRYFSVKNCTEVIDILPTLTTSCGSKTGMGSVAFFYVREEVLMVLNDKNMSMEEQRGMLAKLLYIAKPEERAKAVAVISELYESACGQRVIDIGNGRLGIAPE